jgi:PhnB protein
MTVKPMPEGYHSVTPYLIVHDANAAIEYYSKAFGAAEVFRMPMGGKIGHAELKIGDSIVMLSDEWPEMGMVGPKNRGGTSVGLMIYVPDVDRVFKRALDAGAVEERAVKNEFYGDRTGTLLDPFGHRWFIATHVEDVPQAEMKRRMDEMARSQVGST